VIAAALILAQLFAPGCAAELKSRGAGSVVAAQVAPYANCLNRTIGTEEQLHATCRIARKKAADYHGAARVKAKVLREVRWLDTMTRERARCETALKVKP
jgi:hypothetical protein